MILDDAVFATSKSGWWYLNKRQDEKRSERRRLLGVVIDKH
jgi:hypothetical protein